MAEDMISRLSGDELSRMVLDHLYDGVYVLDTAKNVQYWSKGAERITGFTSGDVSQRCCADNLLHHVDEEGVSLCRDACPVSATLKDGQVRESRVYLHHKDGQRVPVYVRVFPVRGADGSIIGAVEVFSDVPDRERAAKEIQSLHELAMLDPVTQLANRHYLEARLDSRLAEIQRYNGSMGVLFADLDHFKSINDTYGHAVGDQALRMVGQTLIGATRLFDTVGRWGGDEFMAIVTSIDEAQLRVVAERVRRLVGQSFVSADSGRIEVTASIGVALATPEDTPATILARADESLYRSKAAGRNCVTLAAA
jgi:diguanylate cyclase (GGDEF)-like protein/PAS domain S-box-containing protein